MFKVRGQDDICQYDHDAMFGFHEKELLQKCLGLIVHIKIKKQHSNETKA